MMKKYLALSAWCLAAAILAEEVTPPPTALQTNAATAVSTSAGKPQRRARMPRERRREGAIPGLVTIPFGKTASGERTHLYRIMGQGGVVADFLDYGARPYRLYVPDAMGALTDVIDGARPSIPAYEKAGDLAAVWKMTPIRRPRATGLVFEIEGTNKTSQVVGRADPCPPLARVMYLLDAENRLTVESTIADTNAVRWVSDLRLAPLANRPLKVTTPETTHSFSTTTNVTTICTRPLTNAVQRAEMKFGGIIKL